MSQGDISEHKNACTLAPIHTCRRRRTLLVQRPPIAKAVFTDFLTRMQSDSSITCFKSDCVSLGSSDPSSSAACVMSCVNSSISNDPSLSMSYSAISACVREKEGGDEQAREKRERGGREREREEGERREGGREVRERGGREREREEGERREEEREKRERGGRRRSTHPKHIKPYLIITCRLNPRLSRGACQCACSVRACVRETDSEGDGESEGKRMWVSK